MQTEKHHIQHTEKHIATDTVHDPVQKPPVRTPPMPTTTATSTPNTPTNHISSSGSPRTRRKSASFASTIPLTPHADPITTPSSSPTPAMAATTLGTTSMNPATTTTTLSKRNSGRSRRNTGEYPADQLLRADQASPSSSLAGQGMTSAPDAGSSVSSTTSVTPTSNGAKRGRTRRSSSAAASASPAATTPLGPNKININTSSTATPTNNNNSKSPSETSSNSTHKKSHKYVPKSVELEPFDPQTMELVYWPDGNGDITANNILDPDSTVRSTRNKLKSKETPPAPSTLLMVAKLSPAARPSPGTSSSNTTPSLMQPKKSHKKIVHPASPTKPSHASSSTPQPVSHHLSPTSSKNKRRKPDADLPTALDNRKKPRLIPPASTAIPLPQLHSALPPQPTPPVAPALPLTPLDGLRAEFVSERESKLQVVVGNHDKMVRELYHMEVYMTMLAYDPEKARLDKSERLVK
ncbi:hypothetical protein BC938DRAFT_476868, partial [Jimgerdemannia flammicorona]